MNIKTELWNGHKIRFIEKELGEWWAVAADVTDALGIQNTTQGLMRVEPENQALYSIKGISKGNEAANIINEFGIYELILGSRKKEAKEFKRWVFGVIKELREASGLEGFQVFRLLDKEHQREAMKRLRDGLRSPVRVDYMKANSVADKAISNMFGFPKMLKKGQMTPDMLVKRQSVLDDTVNLMSVNESFGLGLSISNSVYAKYR